MEWILAIRIVLLLCFGLYLSRLDLKTNTIPNKITFPLIITGLFLSLIEFGISIKLIYAYLILLGVYFFFILFHITLSKINSTQAIGGGDVKFILSIASLLPFSYSFIGNIFVIEVLFYAIIIMFIMSLVKTFGYMIMSKFPKSQLFLDANINNVKVTFVPILWISCIISLII